MGPKDAQPENKDRASPRWVLKATSAPACSEAMELKLQAGTTKGPVCPEWANPKISSVFPAARGPAELCGCCGVGSARFTSFFPSTAFTGAGQPQEAVTVHEIIFLLAVSSSFGFGLRTCGWMM